MVKSLRLMTLTSAIGIALVGAGMQTATNAYATELNVSEPVAVGQVNGSGSYIVTFSEDGLLHYKGNLSGMQATAPQATGSRKLDVHSAAAQSYQNYLLAQRTVHITAIESALGRMLPVTHHYAITRNAIAANLSADEAASIAALPGVISVRPAGVQQLDTYRGPKFIGADTIWNGTNTPTLVGTRGEGITVGVIDTGANSGHPSFANDTSCDFRPSRPKVVAVDCSATDVNGYCAGPDPQAAQGNGHGVHTSSTVAGNTIDNTASPAPLLPDGVTMSGVAPCAAIISYKSCPTNSCPGEDLFAAIENAIADGVDVINYSISGGNDPWNDLDRQFLDAVNADVFVSASAGNTSASVPTTVGNVNHLGPWTMTVAASTQDQLIGPQLSVTGPDPLPVPPPDLAHIPLNPGNTTVVPDTTNFIGGSVVSYPTNVIGCTTTGGFPGGYFSGHIALVQRGTCSFTEKITNAFNAGAYMVVVANNQTGTINMDTTGSPAVPAFSILQVDGNALLAYVAPNNPPAPPADQIFANGFDMPAGTIADYNRSLPSSRQGDLLASFSLRGPTPAPLANETKPDITGPGVDIYAALTTDEGSYGFLSGTSMSSPHVAGAAALVRAVHPNWTVPEVKSAMMMTATNAAGVQEDGTTPWSIDDVGAGRIDLTKAALAGLTMNESYANFVAADPALMGDVKTLNLPHLRNLTCNPNCTWTRTFKNQLPVSGTWNATFVTDPSFAMTATPPSFTLAPGATQSVLFRATPNTLITSIKFGRVLLTEASALAPVQRLTAAVQSTNVPPPTVTCTGGTCTFKVDQLAASFSGLGCATWAGCAPGLLWLNRFTPSSTDYPITITTVSTIFGSGAGWNAAGDKVSVFVYQDADTDPSNGAVAVGTPTVYTMGTPANAFVDITLAPPVVVTGPGDIIIALSNPNATNVGGRPASMDAGPFVGRSWIGDASGDGTAAPDLATSNLGLNPDVIPGLTRNYLIRATGTNASGPIVLGVDTSDKNK